MSKFQKILLHISPFVIIVGFIFINPMISLFILTLWTTVITVSGVEVKNYTTGDTEVFRDPAIVINSLKNQAKDLAVEINIASDIASNELSTAIELRNLRLEVLGTSIKEQDEHKENIRNNRKEKAAIALEARKAANAAKIQAYRDAYLNGK